MCKQVRIVVDEDVYDKFCMALKLTNEDETMVIENSMRNYITSVFSRISQEYSSTEIHSECTKTDKDFYAKSIQKIPTWSKKPNQYNHKIIRAFFEAETATGEVHLDTMELLCSDKNRPELYVPTFKSNYAQMKIDTYNSHGKVFEDDGDRVWIWKVVEKELRRYKDSFLS